MLRPIPAVCTHKYVRVRHVRHRLDMIVSDKTGFIRSRDSDNAGYICIAHIIELFAEFKSSAAQHAVRNGDMVVILATFYGCSVEE